MPARGTATNRGVASNRGLASGRLTASGRLNVSGGGGGGGGASLIDSSGSTLGAVPAILTTKLLTADGQVYFSDGTNWLPFTNPGWPRRDAAGDFEFEGTADTLPAGWSDYRKDAGVAYKINSTVLSSFIFSSTADEKLAFTGFTPAATTNFRFYAQVCSRVIPGGNDLCGIFAKQTGATGNLLVLEYGCEPTGNNPRVEVSQWNDVNSFVQKVLDTNLIGISTNTPVVLSVRSDGTNVIFEYCQFFGGSELRWQMIYAESLANFIVAFDDVGFFYASGTQVNSLTERGTYMVDWIRKLAV